MNVIEVITNLLVIVLSAGFSFYSYWLFRLFRGGTMGKTFVFFTVAPLFHILAEVFHILIEFSVIADYYGLVHSVFEALFFVLLFPGLYALASAWRAKPPFSDHI